MLSDNSNKEDLLLAAVRQGINKRLSEVADEEFEKAKKNIEERRAEIITGVVLQAEKVLSFERYGMELRVTLKDEHHA